MPFQLFSCKDTKFLPNKTRKNGLLSFLDDECIDKKPIFFPIKKRGWNIDSACA